MKSTGIVRKVDELGRVVIPIEIYVDGSSIVLKKYEPNCVFCGNTKTLMSYKDKLVCSKCAQKLADLESKNKEENE